MKKFIAIMLGASAMIACTKTSVSYEPTGEIALAPVSNVNKTKASITGIEFPKQIMGVFAYYKSDVADGQPSGKFTDATTYLNNVQFNENGSNLWAGWLDGAAHPYYWPKNGSLVFTAYSPLLDASGAAAIKSHTFSANGDAVVSDVYASDVYTQSNSTANTIDFMWSPVTSESHTKTSNNVSMTFYHAMSWITFRAKFTKPAAMKETTDPVITIKSVVLEKVATKGSYKTDGNSIEWTPSAESKENITVYNDSKSLSATLQTIETNPNGTLVIPQSIDDNLVATIVYTQHVPGTAVVEQTATLHLNKCRVGTGDLTSWANAKHYFYDLNFTFGEDEEILIAPKVEKWDDVTVDTTPADAIETVTPQPSKN